MPRRTQGRRGRPSNNTKTRKVGQKAVLNGKSVTWNGKSWSPAKTNSTSSKSSKVKVGPAKTTNSDRNRKYGTKATLNGKTVQWAGQDYGWQSPESYRQVQQSGELKLGASQVRGLINSVVDAIPPEALQKGVSAAQQTAAILGPLQTALGVLNPVSVGLSNRNADAAGRVESLIIDQLSNATNIDPLVLEAGVALAGGGANKLGPKAKKLANQAARTDLGSRFLEAGRDLTGGRARPLGTRGSVGAAGAPQTNRSILSQADPIVGRRLNQGVSEAADGIDRLRIPNAPGNTTRGRGQARPADAQRRQLDQQQQAALADARQRQEWVAFRNSSRSRDIPQPTRLQGRTQQAVNANAARVERRNRDSMWTASRRMTDDGQMRPMERRYDVTHNADRMPVATTRRNTVGRRNTPVSDLRINSSRPANTVSGGRVLADSRARENRLLTEQAAARRRQIQQTGIDADQSRIAARNRIAGNPQRQQQAIERGRRMGNDRLAQRNAVQRALSVRGNIEPQGGRLVSNQRPGNAITGQRGATARQNLNTRASKAGERLRQQAQARRKQKGTQSLQSRQGTQAGPINNRIPNQAPKQGQGGQRLFTPQNRAAAVQRKGSQLIGNNKMSAAEGGGKLSFSQIEDGFEQGQRIHDIHFRSKNDSKRFDRPSEQRKGGYQTNTKSLAARKLDSANIKNQLATIMSDIKPGDIATASPMRGVGGKQGRARLYDRMTKGALATDPATGSIRSVRGQNNTFTNYKGKEVNFDPETLRNDINKLAKQTPKQLQGRAIGGNSSMRVRSNTQGGTKVTGPGTKPPEGMTKTRQQRAAQALIRINNLAKKNGITLNKALGMLN